MVQGTFGLKKRTKAGYVPAMFQKHLSKAVLFLALAFSAAPDVRAQLISGVTDRSIYTDSVSFNVANGVVG